MNRTVLQLKRGVEYMMQFSMRDMYAPRRGSLLRVKRVASRINAPVSRKIYGYLST